MPTMSKPPACSHPKSRQPVPSVSCLSTGDEQRPVYSHPVLQRVTRQPALPGRHPRTRLALTVTRSQGRQTPSTGVAGTITGLVNRSLQLPVGPHTVPRSYSCHPAWSISPTIHQKSVPSQPVTSSVTSPHLTSPAPLSTGVVNTRPR
jgi:hypothetical protein